MQVKYRKELDLIPVYVPGKPIVKEAVSKALEEANLYPDGNATLLKETIAQKFGISPEMILPTCGSDENGLGICKKQKPTT